MFINEIVPLYSKQVSFAIMIFECFFYLSIVHRYCLIVEIRIHALFVGVFLFCHI